MKEFIWSTRVYYEDTDAGGVVYHGNYLRFMERARTEWLRSLGYSQEELREKEQIQFVVRHITMKFHQSARLDDLLDINTRIKKLGNAGFVFEQEIHNNEVLLCSAEIDIACIHVKTGKPQRIPNSLKARFNYVN